MGRMKVRNGAGVCCLLLATLLGCAAVPRPEADVPGRPGVLYLPGPKVGTTFESVKDDLVSLLTGPSEQRQVWLRRIGDDAELGANRYYLYDPTIVQSDRVGFYASTTLHYALLFEELPGKEIAVRKAERKYDRRYVVEIAGLTGKLFTNDLSAARRLADDLFFLQQREATVILQDALTPEFEELAAKYRALAVKPRVTEEQRRRIVQANTLSQQKDYGGALEIYGKALAVDPVAYPEAYFNMALLAAQENRYGSAIRFMKKYLLLAPEAKDARAAQDKVYEWEILAERK